MKIKFYFLTFLFAIKSHQKAFKDIKKCETCIQSNGKYCLNTQDIHKGTCCDPNGDERDMCKNQKICAQNTIITNPIL